MSGRKTTPWKNGFYRMGVVPSMIFAVDGENVRYEKMCGRPSDYDTNPKYQGTWKFGDFGEASADVAAAAGKKHYNVNIQLPGLSLEFKGILSDDGLNVFYWGWANAVDVFRWQSEESILALKQSGDSADAPPSPYKIQPENQGKFLFISGAPGLGKSTTGQLLGKKAGYVLFIYTMGYLGDFFQI